MPQDITTIKETLAILTDWQEKYTYILELGDELEPLSNEYKQDKYKITGCVSQVWLYIQPQIDSDGNYIYKMLADSDSHMVKGLLAIILAIFNNKTAKLINSSQAQEELATLNLASNISSQRLNGLNSIIQHIKTSCSK